MVSPSRCIVQCGYDSCKYTSERRNLKRHVNKKHNGGIVKEKLTILNIKKYMVSNNDNANDVIESHGIPSTSEMSPETSSPFELANIQEEDDFVQTSEPPNALLLEHKEETLLKLVTNLGDTIDTLTKSNWALHNEIRKISANNQCNSKGNTESAKLLIRELSFCRSLKQLQEEKGNVLALIPEESIVLCKACQNCSDNNTGVFMYDFSLGTNFENQILPKAFQLLKRKVYMHCRSHTHIRNCRKLLSNELVHRTSIEAQIDGLQIDTSAKSVSETANDVAQSSLPQNELIRNEEKLLGFGIDAANSSNIAKFLIPSKNVKTNPHNLNDRGIKNSCNYYDFIAKTWACELEKMSQKQQLFASRAIQTILLQGQLGNLTRDFINSNPKKLPITNSERELVSHSNDPEVICDDDIKKEDIPLTVYFTDM